MNFSFRKRHCNLFLNFFVLSFAIAAIGCAEPKIVKFNLSILSNAPSPEDATYHQGTLHVCAGSSIRLEWAVKGGASLSASAGPRYQLPACFDLQKPASEGRRDIPATQIAEACGQDSVFRLSASHTVGQRSGPCPGPGCPNADHEVKVATKVTEAIGNKVGECVNGGYEVTNNKASFEWDDHYRVGSVFVTSLKPVLEQIPDRTLILSHNNKQASFNASTLTSDAFRGEKISGAWVLRLSNCASPPPALIVRVEAECAP